jgi:hypothetical protein
MTCHVSAISISLSLKELNKNSPGYTVCFVLLSIIQLANCVDECSDVSNLHLYKFCCPFIVIKLHCIQKAMKPQRYQQPQQYQQQHQPRQYQGQIGEQSKCWPFFTSLFANSFVFVLKIHMA